MSVCISTAAACLGNTPTVFRRPTLERTTLRKGDENLSVVFLSEMKVSCVSAAELVAKTLRLEEKGQRRTSSFSGRQALLLT